MTISLDRPPAAEMLRDEQKPLRNQNRWLKIAVAVLALVALAFGAVLAYNLASGDDSAAPDEVTRILDDFSTANAENDVDLMRSIITDDYVQTIDFYRPGELSPAFTSVGPFSESSTSRLTYQVERFGDPIVTGDGPWVVSVGETWMPDTFNRDSGTATYVIVDDEGALKIDKYYWAGVKGVLES